MARYNAASYAKNQLCQICSNPYDRAAKAPMASGVASDYVPFHAFYKIVRPSFHRDFDEEDLMGVFKRCWNLHPSPRHRASTSPTHGLAQRRHRHGVSFGSPHPGCLQEGPSPKDAPTACSRYAVELELATGSLRHRSFLWWSGSTVSALGFSRFRVFTPVSGRVASVAASSRGVR